MTFNGMRRSSRFLASAALCFGLSACGPSDSEVVAALGVPSHRVQDITCKEASGKPGYMCSFMHDGNVLTRRLVKASGGWQMAY